MSQAICALRGKQPWITYTFPQDQKVLEFKPVLSWVPGLFGAGGITLSAHTISLNPCVKTYSVQDLAEVICHEAGHIWQYDRWGTWSFYAMYAPRLIFYGSSEEGRNDIEDYSYALERTNSGDFLMAAEYLRSQKLF